MQVCIPEPFTNNNNNINLEESKNIKIVGLSITDPLVFPLHFNMSCISL